MRALIVDKPGSVGLTDRPEPEPREGEVALRPVAVGLCGTDLEIIDGSIDPTYVRYPIVLGHEWVGRVVGPSGTPDVGALAVVEGIVPCGECAACAAGATNLCEIYDEFGFTRDGAATELVLAPARLVHPLAPDVRVDDAVLTEPAAVVWRALRRAAPPSGAKVLVVGDGTVALLAAHLVQSWSPSRVDVLGLRPAQAPLVEAAGGVFGTDTTVADGTHDLVIEAAGAVEAVATALRAPRRGGAVVLLGLAGHGLTVPLPADDVVNSDLTILGSFSYTAGTWREVVDQLNAGKLHPGFVITDRHPLEEWPRAVDALRSAPGRRGKVILELGDAS